MATLQVPRGENAVEIKADQSGQQTGSFKSYWTALFSILAKRFNAASSVPQVTSPDASDLATAITLANELKARLNALNTALGS